jgi:hypothetical protein
LEYMSIKKIITILIATTILSVPAIQIKTAIQDIHQSNHQIRLNAIKATELKKKAELAYAAEQQRLKEVEAQRVAAEKAAQAAKEREAAIARLTPKTVTVPGQTSSEGGCGAQDPGKIYDILTGSGVPRISAIQILGSWKTESGFDHCQKRGDGGIAWGLNSWHPGRRGDMPADLKGQVLWAIHTEMKRDCASCYAAVMQGESVWSVRDAIKRSTRWGIEGARWTYADQFAQIF